MDRLATSLQTTIAATFTGMMCIDLSFDLPVIQRSADEDLLRAQSYYHHIRTGTYMPSVITGLLAVTGVSMIYSLYRRANWRRLLAFASMGLRTFLYGIFSAAAPYFMLKVEPAEEALTVASLPREVLREHLTTICHGHILLFGLCCFNILLLSTEPPRVAAKPKRP